MTRITLILMSIGLLTGSGCQRGNQGPQPPTEGEAAPADPRSAEIAKPEDEENGKEADGGTTPAVPPALTVKLGKKQVIALPPPNPATDAEKKTIKALIASLAKLDTPDFGLSSTLTGRSFSPVAGQARASTMLLTDHNIQPSAALRQLVEMGPRALPHLLDAINDRTPTKLKVEHDGLFGAMWLENEVWGNALNPVEQSVLSKRKKPSKGFPDTCVQSYTVKVGDVCFVALGQIVGRHYHCVRYQPTACIIINSPTEDKGLRAEVRQIWSSKDPARTLLDSLLVDYATEGIFNGKSLDGWDGSEFQVTAALRLAYYYPKESSPFLAARLRALDVKAAGDDLDGWMLREVRNGVHAVDFINAVKWSKEPLIQEALLHIGKVTDDTDIADAISLKPRGRSLKR